MTGNQQNRPPVRIIGGQQNKAKPKGAGVLKSAGDVAIYNNTLAPMVLSHAPHNARIINPTKIDKTNASRVVVPARGSIVIPQAIWDKLKVQPAIKAMLDLKHLRVGIKNEPDEAAETVSTPKAPGDLAEKAKVEMSGGMVGKLTKQVTEGEVVIANQGLKEIEADKR